jgi:hypothetical protein
VLHCTRCFSCPVHTPVCFPLTLRQSLPLLTEEGYDSPFIQLLSPSNSTSSYLMCLQLCLSTSRGNVSLPGALVMGVARLI